MGYEEIAGYEPEAKDVLEECRYEFEEKFSDYYSGCQEVVGDDEEHRRMRIDKYEIIDGWGESAYLHEIAVDLRVLCGTMAEIADSLRLLAVESIRTEDE